jgi:hypothetical protein
MIVPIKRAKAFFTSDSESFAYSTSDSEIGIPVGHHVGAFGTKRKNDVHTGVDLYCPAGEFVYSIEEGIVTLIEIFTGQNANSPWWNETYAVHIEGPSGVIVYGEISPFIHITIGKKVLYKEPIGHVMKVLKNDKGRPMSMLHLELYKHGTRNSCVWRADKEKDGSLLDPTPLLKSCASIK